MNRLEIEGKSASKPVSKHPATHLDLADKWILSRLNHAIRDYNESLAKFRINEASKLLYDFIW
ncbi:MAG: class I tRNA ligase family protein, partial [Bacteroidota bacterium]